MVLHGLYDIINTSTFMFSLHILSIHAHDLGSWMQMLNIHTQC